MASADHVRLFIEPDLRLPVVEVDTLPAQRMIGRFHPIYHQVTEVTGDQPRAETVSIITLPNIIRGTNAPDVGPRISPDNEGAPRPGTLTDASEFGQQVPGILDFGIWNRVAYPEECDVLALSLQIR
jgi:hypothetical protein